MPSLPDNGQSCNPHLAALVAINVVTQVLDEAQDIVNAANDSGQPWRYIWDQKKGNGEFCKNAGLLGVMDFKGCEKIIDCEIKQEDTVYVTSPQKDIGDNTKSYNDNCLIGQGDEDMQTRTTGMRSPSMAISCLFDMNELEQAVLVEVTEDVVKYSESRNFLTSSVAQLVESSIDLALNIVCGDVLIPEQHVMSESTHSSYSFLADAVVNDVPESVTFHVDNVNNVAESHSKCTQAIKVMDVNEDVEITKKDIDLYEKTFSTMNRDYEKFSEEEYYLEAQKSLPLHEVELPTNVSSENIAVKAEAGQTKMKLEEPVVPTVVADQKHSLMKRCRLQGARFMTRLRSWWWKQRLIGKRKEGRPGLMSGCPLSPKARNRTASLLDNRKMRSPSPSRTVAWKFYTLNEALFNSYSRKVFELHSSDQVDE